MGLDGAVVAYTNLLDLHDLHYRRLFSKEFV